MRFTTLLSAGIFALSATAQSTSSSTSVTPPTTTDPATAAQNSQAAAITACIDACKPGDVDCTSKCITVPNPSNADVDKTNKCVADCPKGNGTATDNLNYSNCVNGCISKYYFTASAGVPAAQPTGGSGSGSGSGSNTGAAPSGSSKPTGTGSGQSTGTGTAATTSSTGTNAAAPGLALAGSTAGIVGFFAALLAL